MRVPIESDSYRTTRPRTNGARARRDCRSLELQWLAVAVDLLVRQAAREPDRAPAADHHALDDGLSAVRGRWIHVALVGAGAVAARRGTSWQLRQRASYASFGADHDDRLVVEGRDAVDDALSSRRRLAADDADRFELVDLLREREQRRHGPERLAAEVEVEARADDAMAARDELAHHADDRVVEELHLVDADDRRVRRHQLQDLLADEHRARLERVAVVRAHELAVEADVDGRLEHLDGAARDDRTPHTADELLALSAEHRADDHLEARVGPGVLRRQLTARSGLRLRGRLLRLLGPVSLVEAIDATLDVQDVLLAREERVALRADLDVKLGLRRSGHERVAARADDLGVDVFGVDLFLHGVLLSMPLG